MKKSTIAAQMYTFREQAQTEKDLASTFARLKEIGYEAVQVSGIGPIDHRTVKKLADQNGLAICATHIPFDRLTGELEAVAEQHKLWDCKYVGLGMAPESYRTSEEGYRKFAQEASEIGLRLKRDYGLQFVYHNHQVEFEKFGGRTGMDILLEESDPEGFGFELDMYWVQAGGGDPAQWAHKVEGRMQVVHLKDMEIVDGKPVFAEIGQGNMNTPAIIEACRATGVEWYVVEQDICRRDPFESVTMSLDYLHQYLEREKTL
ncbi:sugar phosphate isomerase/epimerase [Saccharibacillus sp. CPCC 101409]|uniref:sugar phosphate isomerase/epimerase family protein n=1 Tax=Saccharibacillus sp. CPCC 101409 TaxID=3058041 RepID=UPI00267115B7|nr:sugar phosphate isomerase/epimerase [Saccharibacillus sp. CPCC 101409]MDO3410951.1 sugar phosphate isomerase/epimerase [Saccharibacillus sp. CPCC 101409]